MGFYQSVLLAFLAVPLVIHVAQADTHYIHGNFDAKVGQELNLYCDATFYGSETWVRWYFDGEELLPDNRTTTSYYTEMSRDESTTKGYSHLRIYPAQLSDSGEYSCRSHFASTSFVIKLGSPGEDEMASSAPALTPPTALAVLIAALKAGMVSAVFAVTFQ